MLFGFALLAQSCRLGTALWLLTASECSALEGTLVTFGVRAALLVSPVERPKINSWWRS